MSEIIVAVIRSSKASLHALLFVPVFIVGHRASAGALAGVGGNLTFEYGTNGRTYEVRQPFSLRGGYRFQLADFYLEYPSFATSQATSFIEIERVHHELITWARKTFKPEWVIAPYAAVGVGYQKDVVTTAFATRESKDHGDFVPLGALAAGLQMFVVERVDITLEARMATSSNYAPNPLLSAAFYIGCVF